MRHLGLDPGMTATGWGIIDAERGWLGHVANGAIAPPSGLDTAARLAFLHDGLTAVIRRYRPDVAAIEEVFVARNPASAIKLGMARGVVMAAAAAAGLSIAEYAARAVKKAVVGVGGADKAQVQAMVRRVLPGVALNGPDAADALAVAICHAGESATRRRWAVAEARP
ncbi:MAG: crossover junction endodeoxyribonuclease RuvC [Alphaproteobacteria bacterium]